MSRDRHSRRLIADGFWIPVVIVCAAAWIALVAVQAVCVFAR